MVEDDFIQEEYEPITTNNTYVESIKFSDDFTTKSSTSFEQKPHAEKVRASKAKKVHNENVTNKKSEAEKKEDVAKKRSVKPSIEKNVVEREEPEKAAIKKKPAQNNKQNSKIDNDEIYISFDFFKKFKSFFNKKDRSNVILTLIALIVIFAIALFILNIDKIFPDTGLPLAYVNGEVITSKDVENTVKTIPPLYRALIDDDELLNQTIVNKILLQESKKLGISVTDNEVELAIDKAIANAQMSKNEFKEYLKEQNLTYDDMTEFYKLNLATEKLLQKTAYVGVNVSSKQIKEFYNNNSKDLGNFTFDEISEQIEAYLLQQARQVALQKYIEQLMKTADIRILNQETTTETAENDFSSDEVDKYVDCATKNGLDKNSVIFIYSDSCPHCQNMKPIVTDLETEEYKFKWASVYDTDIKTALSECYQDVLAGGVPQFICAKNGQTLVGEKSKEVLRAFAESCNK